jgi:hypothetical protein
MANKVQQLLESTYNKDLTDKILEAYLEIESNFFLEKWKPSELDAGHFVESVRRLLELELTGTYTPFNAKQQSGHESFRMLIPRILKSVYNIRNKRGVGHIKDISPNEMDATLILHSVKWVLSEIVRLKSNLSIPDTQRLIDDIVERKVDMIWKESDFQRILETKIPTKDQVLILLYNDKSQDIEDLREIIEYKNKSNFKILIKKLHVERLIEFRASGQCLLSPKGRLRAEELIKKYKYSA